MRVLHLTLKKKWFDMIASGEKKEEYREIKDYWIKRLTDKRITDPKPFKSFDYIIFRNSYSKNAPTLKVECKGIRIAVGNPDWGNQYICFCISLGEIFKL